MSLRVEQIPGEPSRFLVESESRPGLLHVVDMEWQEGPRDKPRPMCGCEQMMAKGEVTCKHVAAVVEHLHATH